ncbi:MAG: hypothetical protein RL094_449 [Candidatus Parcubacteria bacterium]
MKVIQPRPYQAIAVRAALKALRSKLKRALVVMATGLGKTITAAMITKALFAKGRILFLVHNTFILDHAVSEFKLIFGEDMDVSIYKGGSKTAPHKAQFVFATWQTMGINLNNWDTKHFDLVIVDEAHHTEAITYAPTIRYFLAAKLGITATPDRNDDADIREVFGEEVVNFSLEEAIVNGWLPPIEYRLCHDNSLDNVELQKVLDEIRTAKRRMSIAEINRRVFIRKKAKVVAKTIMDEGKPALIFCKDISHAKRMARIIPKSRAFHSGKDAKHKTQRKIWDRNLKTLSDFRSGKLRYVTAVDAFNEGVDVPAIHLIALLRQHGVITRWKQQIGRGARPDDGKTKLVVMDFVSNLEHLQFLLSFKKKIAQMERKKYPKGPKVSKSIEISGDPFTFTFTQEIVNLMEVLESCSKDFYATWEEASEVVKKLGITGTYSYRQKRSFDSKLHSAPDQFYANFPGWKTFFGRVEYYSTWEDASIAVKALGIRSWEEYKSLHKNDPRLPPDLYGAYPALPNFKKLCGLEEKNLYVTVQEASTAAIALGIKTSTQYWKDSHLDGRLPKNPRNKYKKKFPGWDMFWGKKK